MSGLQTKVLHYAAVTHAGKRLRSNQDALLLNGTVKQQAGFWHGQVEVGESLRFAIADGIGSLPSAAAASRRLLEELAELDKTHPQLLPRQRLIPLHNRLVKASQSKSGLRNAGSTLITAEISKDGQIGLWHVGDSRGYLLGAKGLSQLTDDHTLAFCLSRLGRHSHSNLQAFGKTQMGKALDNHFIFSPEAEEPFIGLQLLRLKTDEVLLMVSDGITAYLSDKTLCDCLQHIALTVCIKRIFEKVMSTAAGDNFSAVAFSLKDNAEYV
jgi:protein phosphatase